MFARAGKCLWFFSVLAVFRDFSVQGADTMKLKVDAIIKPTEFLLQDLVYVELAVSNCTASPLKVLQIDPTCVLLGLVEGRKDGLVVRKRELQDGLRAIQVLQSNNRWTAKYPLFEFADVLKPGRYVVSYKFAVEVIEEAKVRYEEVVTTGRVALIVKPRNHSELQESIKEIVRRVSEAKERDDALNSLLAINDPSVIEGLTQVWPDLSPNQQIRTISALIRIGDEQALVALRDLSGTIQSPDVELHLIQCLGTEIDSIRNSHISAEIWTCKLQSDHVDSRLASVGYLAEYAKEAALRELPKMLKDSSKEVRDAAERGLAHINEGH
jgi:hypothetical protein